MGDEYPLVPRQLPDGTMVWEERGKARDVIAALRAYDERCSLVRNFEDATWEIWRKNEDGTQGRVGVWRQEYLPEPLQVVASLHAHDTRRGYDPIAALARKESERQLSIDATLTEIAEASADRVHYELVDEISAHAPAARPISTGPRGHRKRAERT